MATNDSKSPSTQRRVQRDQLYSQEQSAQYRLLRLAMLGLFGFLALILIIGLVYEYAVKPSTAVADVNGSKITLSDWHERVVFERKQTAASLDQFYDLVGGDVQQLQQFAGQQFAMMQYPSLLGQQVLFGMINDELIVQEASKRNIVVKDEQIEKKIEERLNFYGGELPTATATPTASPTPLPSITPVPTEVTPGAATITPTATAEPTVVPTPMPTNTPVSADAYKEAYQKAIDDYVATGGTESLYRQEVKLNLLREGVRDAIASEAETPVKTEDQYFDFFYIRLNTKEEADALLGRIETEGYLPVWNEIHTTPRVTTTQSTAEEIPWSTLQTITNNFGTALGDVLATIALDTPSGVIENSDDQSGTLSYFIVQLRGKEMRPLTESAMTSEKEKILNDWLQEKSKDARIFDIWENNVPNRPLLDRKFTQQQPTPEPATGGEPVPTAQP